MAKARTIWIPALAANSIGLAMCREYATRTRRAVASQLSTEASSIRIESYAHRAGDTDQLGSTAALAGAEASQEHFLIAADTTRRW